MMNSDRTLHTEFRETLSLFNIFVYSIFTMITPPRMDLLAKGCEE